MVIVSVRSALTSGALRFPWERRSLPIAQEPLLVSSERFRVLQDDDEDVHDVVVFEGGIFRVDDGLLPTPV